MIREVYHLPLRLELIIDDKMTVVCGLPPLKVKRRTNPADKRPGKRRILVGGHIMSYLACKSEQEREESDAKSI